MLNLWRRHLTSCLKRLRADGVRDFRSHKKCGCPIWVQGTLNGQWLKKSLDLRNWQAAQTVRDWEVRGSAVEPHKLTMDVACDRFYAEKVAERWRPATLSKYLLLCNELKVSFGGRLNNRG